MVRDGMGASNRDINNQATPLGFYIGQLKAPGNLPHIKMTIALSTTSVAVLYSASVSLNEY